MAAPQKKKNYINKELCRMITPEFRVSYPHVFKAQAPKPTDKPKFSVTMLFAKDSDLMGEDLEGNPVNIKTVIKNAKIAEFGPDKDNWPADLESPVIDGDDPAQHKNGEKEGYKGHWVIKATTNEDQKPGIVSAENIPITNQADFYPGCYARAYVYARVWEYMGKQGVQFILDHVQKTKDGKAFGGKKPVNQVFKPINAGKGKAAVVEAEEEMDFR